MSLSQFLETFPLSWETQHWTEAWLAGIVTLLGTFDFVLFIKAGGLWTSTETQLKLLQTSLLSPVEPAQPQLDGEHSGAEILCPTAEELRDNEPVDVTSSIYPRLWALQQMWILMG